VTKEPEIKIIYEDADVLVIDKPAGLMVHGDGRSTEPTLVDWLLRKYPKLKDVGEPFRLNKELRIKNKGLTSHNSKFIIHNSTECIARPGIVHRLDKDTSGVLIVAKNQVAYGDLKKQFQDRTAEKNYLALVWGNFTQDEGIIDRPIGKSAKDFRQKSAAHGARGALRPAVTHWRVIERFPIANVLKNISLTKAESSTLLEVTPKTGRTHQIRVHMKAINHPMVCDKLYAPNRTCPIGALNRQALHAASLTVNLPFSDKAAKFEAPLPDDFRKTLDELRRV